MNGFLLIDKPAGVTSFDCVRQLRKILNIRRIGFAGTLDPLATGLMIFALGEATKLLSFLDGSDKVYEVAIKFGGISDTYDSTGQIVEQKNYSIPSRQQVAEVLEKHFIGPQMQVPPIYSAIKIAGKRAYSLARKGSGITLKSRPVNFFEINLTSFSWPLLNLKVHCSSGTYIRSLAHDLGKILGCGGYVEQLRRTKIANWKIQNAVKIADLNSADIASCIKKPEEFFADFIQINLDQSQYLILANGGFIPKDLPGNNLSAGGESATGASVIGSSILEPAKAPFLAIFNDECVGLLEPVLSEKNEKTGLLKFKKKFNLNLKG